MEIQTGANSMQGKCQKTSEETDTKCLCMCVYTRVRQRESKREREIERDYFCVGKLCAISLSAFAIFALLLFSSSSSLSLLLRLLLHFVWSSFADKRTAKKTCKRDCAIGGEKGIAENLHKPFDYCCLQL